MCERELQAKCRCKAGDGVNLNLQVFKVGAPQSEDGWERTQKGQEPDDHRFPRARRRVCAASKGGTRVKFKGNAEAAIRQRIMKWGRQCRGSESDMSKWQAGSWGCKAAYYHRFRLCLFLVCRAKPSPINFQQETWGKTHPLFLFSLMPEAYAGWLSSIAN